MTDNRDELLALRNKLQSGVPLDDQEREDLARIIEEDNLRAYSQAMLNSIFRSR